MEYAAAYMQDLGSLVPGTYGDTAPNPDDFAAIVQHQTTAMGRLSDLLTVSAEAHAETPGHGDEATAAEHNVDEEDPLVLWEYGMFG